MFDSLNLTAYELSVDMLDVHAVCSSTDYCIVTEVSSKCRVFLRLMAGICAMYEGANNPGQN